MRVRTTAAGRWTRRCKRRLGGRGRCCRLAVLPPGRRATPAPAPCPARMRSSERCIEAGSRGGCRLELAAETGRHSRPQPTTGAWLAATPDPVCATPGWRTAGGRTRNDGGGGGLRCCPRLPGIRVPSRRCGPCRPRRGPRPRHRRGRRRAPPGDRRRERHRLGERRCRGGHRKDQHTRVSEHSSVSPGLLSGCSPVNPRTPAPAPRNPGTPEPRT